MPKYVLKVVGERIELHDNKLLSDVLPPAWYQNGLDSLDFTLLWRHFAQQLNVEQIAEALCVHADQRARAENYFKKRIPEARKIVMSCDVDRSRLTGLAKLLPDFLR